jgi:DNA invertase Pin-like site-specific DNA recombinase
MLVGYARISTADQTPELQLEALTKAGCGRIFTETISGASSHRPELNAALAYARPGDTLVVWKLDRLARSLKQLISTADVLKSTSVGLTSLTEAIDTTTASGELFFHIFGALAEFERSLIRERTAAGLKAARSRGRRGGRPKSLSESDVVAAQQLLRNPTISVHSVADMLKVSTSTLYRYVPCGRSGVSGMT